MSEQPHEMLVFQAAARSAPLMSQPMKQEPALTSTVSSETTYDRVAPRGCLSMAKTELADTTPFYTHPAWITGGLR
jgi:hypothetical protein